MTKRADKNCSVLLVEDNKAHADLVSICLKDIMPAECVSHVYDGEEALDFLLCRGIYSGRQKTLPALVILDLRLPKADGIEVLRQLRSHENTKHLPVVIMSSSEAPLDIKSSYDNLASGYVVKPVDFDEFKTAIDSMALYWLKHNRTERESASC